MTMGRIFSRALGVALLVGSMPSAVSASGEKILVFKDSLSYNGHTAAINAGMKLLRSFASANAFTVDTTIRLSSFNAANLAQYAAVVFMYPERAVPSAPSTGISDTMSAEQDSAFKDWLLTGKAYVGVHCDTRLNHNWPWFYKTFLGAKYVNDIGPQNSNFHVADPDEFLTQGIPLNFTGNEQLRIDSLYFTEADTSYKVLIRGDVNDYPANQRWMPFFPFVYRHNYRNARMFHLAPGHNATTWTAANSVWNKLFLNGILYALNRPGYGTTGLAEGPAPMGYALQRLDRGKGPSLRYAVPRKAHVVIRLFDVEGRLVAKLADGTYEAGAYTVALPAGSRGSLGFVDFRAGNFRKGMKIVR
jgi:uncharacterized protein